MEIQNLDMHLERAEKLLFMLSARGYDTSSVNTTLEEIRNQRDVLADALAGNDIDQIRIVQKEILLITQKLAGDIRDLQVTAPDQKKAHFWLEVSERGYKRAQMVENDLDHLGLATSALDSRLSRMKEDLEKAQNAFDRGDTADAKEALKQVREDFRAYIRAVREAIGGKDISSKMMHRILTFATTIESEAQKMENT